MNHQITLEELGLIPKQEKEQERGYAEPKKQYAFPCGGCVCNHCANSVECWDICTGEMNFSCFTCDECKRYDGKGTDKWRTECKDYKITEAYANDRRKKFKVLRPESEEMI